MTTTERFWSKVEKTDGCWEWLGSRKANGYGQFHPTRATYALAHRFAWQLLRGAIPSGLQLDHLCRNRGCGMTGSSKAARLFAWGHIRPGTPAPAVKLTVIRGDQPREPRVSKIAATRTRSDDPTTPTPKVAA